MSYLNWKKASYFIRAINRRNLSNKSEQLVQWAIKVMLMVKEKFCVKSILIVTNNASNKIKMQNNSNSN